MKGELLNATSGHKFRGVSIDSRTLNPGDLFLCIRGERFDGHDYIAQAASAGAAGIVLSDPEILSQPREDRNRPDGPFIVKVPDTLTALQELAKAYRARFPVRLVGVTGTNGKSTTKEMIASITSTQFRTLKTQGNLNNHIGLPLSLLGLQADHQVAVLEMGMSGRGEIRRLAQIAEPEIGVITNISEAHLVQLKNVKNAQKAKGELFQSLKQEGTAIVNADDPLVLELARSLRSKVVSFGIDNPADIQATGIRQKDNEGFAVTVSLFEKTFPLHLPLLGYCNIYNALAAIAAASVLGLRPDQMAKGLESCSGLSQRGEIIRRGSMTLINDAYNANPGSMREALRILANYRAEGKKFFIIGDMLELDEFSEAAHIAVGEAIAQEPVDFLIAVGELSRLAAKAATDGGMPANRVRAVGSQREAAEFLSERAGPGDVLLFKGSRGSKMELALQEFMNLKDA